VLWLTIIVEVGLGYLAYRLFLSQLQAYADPEKRRAFTALALLGFAVVLVGIGGPIAIYYSGIEILKPAGTPFYFLLAANSLYLYAAFRKLPTKAPSEAAGVQAPNVYPPNLFNLLSRGDELKAERLALRSVRIGCFLALASILMAIIALTVILPAQGYVPTETRVEGIIMTAFIFYLFSGLFMLMCKWKQLGKWLLEQSPMFHNQAPYIKVLDGYLWRIIWPEMVVVFGFLTGLIIGIWYAIPLFLLSGTVLILNYPTAKKWNILLSEESEDDSKS
jgi:hypothetical protein